MKKYFETGKTAVKVRSLPKRQASFAVQARLENGSWQQQNSAA
jgi:hypothetical protein